MIIIMITKIIDHFESNNGYGKLKEMKSEHIHTRAISKAVENGEIIKIKPGLYKLIDYRWDDLSSFRDICMANNKAVICLTSAAAYHGLTTFLPSRINIATPHNSIKFKLEYPVLKQFYFSPIQYNTGIEIIETSSGNFKIYSKEKTIVDLFRYRNKIGEDIFYESLKNYMNGKNNINEFIEISTKLRVKNKILPLIKVLAI